MTGEDTGGCDIPPFYAPVVMRVGVRSSDGSFACWGGRSVAEFGVSHHAGRTDQVRYVGAHLPQLGLPRGPIGRQGWRHRWSVMRPGNEWHAFLTPEKGSVFETRLPPASYLMLSRHASSGPATAGGVGNALLGPAHQSRIGCFDSETPLRADPSLPRSDHAIRLG